MLNENGFDGYFTPFGKGFPGFDLLGYFHRFLRDFRDQCSGRFLFGMEGSRQAFENDVGELRQIAQNGERFLLFFREEEARFDVGAQLF